MAVMSRPASARSRTPARALSVGKQVVSDLAKAVRKLGHRLAIVVVTRAPAAAVASQVRRGFCGSRKRDARPDDAPRAATIALAERSALFMELLQAQLVDLGLQRERGAAARETSGPPSDTRLAVVSYEHLLAQPAAALAGLARDIAFPGGSEPLLDALDLQNASVAHARALTTTTSDAIDTNDDVWHAVEATLCTSASGGEAVREACARSLAAWSPRRAAEACVRASDLLLRAELDSQASTTPVPSEVAAHARRAFSAREWPLFPEYRLAHEGDGPIDSAPATCWSYSCCGRAATPGDADTCPLLRESVLSPALAHACWRSHEGRPACQSILKHPNQ